MKEMLVYNFPSLACPLDGAVVILRKVWKRLQVTSILELTHLDAALGADEEHSKLYSNTASEHRRLQQRAAPKAAAVLLAPPEGRRLWCVGSIQRF